MEMGGATGPRAAATGARFLPLKLMTPGLVAPPGADGHHYHCAKRPYNGVGAFLSLFEDPADTPPPTRVETKDERRERKNKERAEAIAYKLEQDLALWDPHNDPQSTADPFKTLFVARINFDTSESKLRREFEVYGPIRNIRLVQNMDNGKPRGYAFIEYEHERDMHSAYKHADGKKIDGRRVLVDVERARTVKGWRPRRLGGGLGSTRKGGPDVNSRFSGRDDGANRSRSRSRDRRSRRSRSKDRRERRGSRERKPRRSRSPRERGGGRREEEERGGGRKRRSRSPRERRRSRSPPGRDRAKRARRSRSGSRRDEDGGGDLAEGQAFGNGQSAPPPAIGSHGPVAQPNAFGEF